MVFSLLTVKEVVVYRLDRFETRAREVRDGDHAFLWMRVEAARCGRVPMALVLLSKETAHGGLEECVRTFFA